MRSLALLTVAVLLIAPGLASAAVTRNGAILPDVALVGPPAPSAPVSSPVLQDANTINVNLQPGWRVTASLSWTDTSGLGNDLDLALGPPSAPPTPLLPPTDPAGAAAWAQLTAQATLLRVECKNFVAQSHNHGGGGSESLSYTVPSGGESGVYRITVTGFFVTSPQPYSLSVTVQDGNGVDVSGANVGAVQRTPFVRTSAHCQFI